MNRKILRFALPFCALLSAPAFAISGGAPIPESVHPEVKKVDLSGGGVCTGTLLAPQVLVTAGHCVRDALAGGSFQMSVDGVSADRYMMHPRYAAGTDDSLAYDVAVVRLSAAFSAYASLASQPVQEGDSVEIVGYGMSSPGDASSVGVKRAGENRVSQVMWGQIVLRADDSGYGAVPEPGDSGGPLFDSSGRLAGVASRAVAPGAGENLGSYIDVTSAEIASFVNGALRSL